MRFIDPPDFDLDAFLALPLMAHLSTASPDGPRGSPVWFLWEEGHLWVIANRQHDTFAARIERDPRCAVGIVDFAPARGQLRHVGMRGRAEVVPFDRGRAVRKLVRYLGDDQSRWDRRIFTLDDGAKPLIFVRFAPDTVVVRDQGYSLD
jgi:hypothetical protein